MKRLIYGVGTNDSDYQVKEIINGKQVICKFYARWCAMLSRCYSEEYQKKYPTYKQCVVCIDWLSFSNFKKWMEKQNWKGNHLDKDLLIQGNKTYSPELCLFVSPQVNSLMVDSAKTRGDYPVGVTFHKTAKRFNAYCSVSGNQKHLGSFDTQEEASEVYKAFKYKLIAEVATNQDEPLKSALLRYKLK